MEFHSRPGYPVFQAQPKDKSSTISWLPYERKRRKENDNNKKELEKNEEKWEEEGEEEEEDGNGKEQV